MIRPACATLAALAFFSCAHGRPQPGPFAGIEALEWKRSVGDGKLDLLARTDPSPLVRARALLALGRIQNPASLVSVEGALSDADPRVRQAAAFAAQLFGLSWQPLPDEQRALLEAALLAAEAAEKDLEVRRRLLDALGRLATPASVERLLERLASPELAEAAALNAGVAQRQKGKLPEGAFAALDGALAGADPAARAAAVYALSLAKDVRARLGLVRGLSEPSPEARAWAAKGLGDLYATDAARKALSEAALADDARRLAALVQRGEGWPAIEAARALAKLAKGCAAPDCPALAELSWLRLAVERIGTDAAARAAQLLLAVAQQGLPESGRGLLAAWRQGLALFAARGGRTQAIAGNLDCRLAAALDRLDGAPKATSSCGLGATDRGWAMATALKEIAQDPPAVPAERLALAQAKLQDPDARVRLAAVELLGSSNAPEARPIARKLLDDRDLIVSAAAAGALAALKDDEALPLLLLLAARAKTQVDIGPSVADALATLGSPLAAPALAEWLTSPEATIRHAAAAALTSLTKLAVRSGETERATAPVPAPLHREVRVRLRTTAGPIELSLDGQAAPITVGNFVALARSRYFEGIWFHRIVPGFVAQGGDPRGDGEGGPGYTIPCEATPLPYQRGTVGMALAGKDTGGSQFFLTLTRQPHLEGRYTAFGTVVSGQETAEALLEADKLLGVDVLD